MKRCLHMLLAVGLAVSLVGCKPADETKPASPPPGPSNTTTGDTTSGIPGESGESTTAAVTLVNLKVPNMV